ncbi:MAG TPA: helix-turn-helix domain-containing protein [Acidimicrobiales bacterium]|nr:helix-turn-helix domain-containing protein [Acidimicrobiales bacterium]
MADRKDFLTAVEVMERLRLGRTTVYEQARLFLASGGAEGIPCRRYGRSLRFPTAELEAMAGGPITFADRHEVVDITGARRRKAPTADPKPTAPRRPTRRTRRPTGTDESVLPFTD